MFIRTSGTGRLICEFKADPELQLDMEFEQIDADTDEDILYFQTDTDDVCLSIPFDSIIDENIKIDRADNKFEIYFTLETKSSVVNSYFRVSETMGDRLTPIIYRIQPSLVERA